MATNDKHQLILKRIFKGNIGKQLQLLWQRQEINEFLKTNPTLSVEQQTYIDSVNLEYETYAEQIREFLGQKSIDKMVPPVDPVE